MTYQVEVTALIPFTDKADAEFTAEALRRIVGKREAVRLRVFNGHVMVNVPDVEKFDMRKVTRGGQEADALGGSIARKLNAALGTTVIASERLLDEETRTWGVDYESLVAQIRGLENAPEDAVAFVKGIAAQVLADNALRGIK